MYDNIGYSEIFAAAEKEPDNFETFRTSPKYHFACPAGDQALFPDYEALGKAALMNTAQLHYFLNVRKSNDGYSNADRFVKVDTVDSRHMMMLTHMLSNTIAFPQDHASVKIFEIGGGFGNWLRLCQDILFWGTWTIIDLPFMIDLQKWYISRNFSDIREPDVYFVNAEDVTTKAFLIDPLNFNVAIATHSLSEFSMPVFEKYLKVLEQVDYLYYSTHATMPSPKMVRDKMVAIEALFDRVSVLASENNTVLNYVFRRKAKEIIYDEGLISQ